jgi:hypothetical protein
MRKLLTFLGSIGLTVTPMASVVTSCTKELTVPVYDKDGSFSQFSDNWNFTSLKTVSLFNPVSDNNDTKDGEDTETSITDLVKDQIRVLLAGRFENGINWNNIINNDQINFYQSTAESSKIDSEKTDAFFENFIKTFSNDIFKTQKIYFTVGKETNLSDKMDLEISNRPLTTQIESFYSDNSSTNGGSVSPYYTVFMWNKESHKFDKSDVNWKSQAQNILVNEFNSYSKITYQGKTYLMKDFFLETYNAEKTLSGTFTTATFENVLNLVITNTGSDKIVDGSVSDLFGITIQNFVS